jgi:hypothetical protein
MRGNVFGKGQFKKNEHIQPGELRNGDWLWKFLEGVFEWERIIDSVTAEDKTRPKERDTRKKPFSQFEENKI